MSDEQKAQRDRANALRKQIEQLKTGSDLPADADEEVERQPGESPKAYLERRAREIARKKRDQP
jgi:hypothetical protein